MAYPPKLRASYGREGSIIIIDSSLSHDEAKDIVSMMIMADQYDIDNHLPSFCTSTQMGGRNQKHRPTSPLLSPLGSQDRPDYSRRRSFSGASDVLCGDLISHKGQNLRSQGAFYGFRAERLRGP